MLRTSTAVIAVVMVLVAVAFPHVPRSSRKVAQLSPNRSNVDVIFNQLLDAVMKKDLTAAASVIDDRVYAKLTGVSCDWIRGKPAMIAAINKSLEGIDVLGLAPLYHITTGPQGAFMVEDMGIGTTNSSKTPAAFRVKLFFYVELNADQTAIEMLLDFVPTQPSNTDVRNQDAVLDYLVAAEAGSTKPLDTLFDAASTLTNFEQGKAEAVVYNGTQVVRHLKFEIENQKVNRYFVDSIYVSCGWVVLDASQVISIAGKDGTTTSSTIKTFNMIFFNATNTNTSVVVEWNRFFWAQVVKAA